MAYPDATDFEAVSNQAGFNRDWLYEVLTGITNINTDLGTNISDQDGNIDLGATKAIKWAATTRISLVSSKVQIANVEIDAGFAPGMALSPSGDVTVDTYADITDLTLSGNLTVVGAIIVNNITDNSITLAQVAEPDDPPDQHSVVWLSNGTGYGDEGDLCMKITETTTKSKTLVDFSAI